MSSITSKIKGFDYSLEYLDNTPIQTSTINISKPFQVQISKIKNTNIQLHSKFEKFLFSKTKC